MNDSAIIYGAACTVVRVDELTHCLNEESSPPKFVGNFGHDVIQQRFFEWPPETDQDRPPYRGLRPLEADDAGIFFGRDAPIFEALDQLRGLRADLPPRLLVILGASGAGKSSFLRAGLFSRMMRYDRDFLPLPIVRPKRAAISGDDGLLRAGVAKL